MSLTYLYNKLEKMNSREQYAYIQNVLLQFQIVPKLDLASIFEDIPGKESSGKNPLGYLVMHLTLDQLEQLIPTYFKELIGQSTFNQTDIDLMNMIDKVVDYIDGEEYFFEFEHPDLMLQVYQFGVAKYEPWSFLKLNPYSLVLALFRHLYKHFYISKTDEESGLPHSIHADCNLRMIELIVTKNKEVEQDET